MEELNNWIQANLGIESALLYKLAASLFICILVWLLRRLVLSVVAKRIEDARALYRWRKSTNYIGFFISLLLVGRIWFEGISSFSTFLGLLSAGVAIALKDPLVNFAGWAYIIWWKPFEVEHRIQVGEHKGDVIDIQTNQFLMMECGNWVDGEQSTGRILHIPNGILFTTTVANYSKGFPFIWDELQVLVTLESDWKKAKQILNSIVEQQTADTTKAAKERIRRAAKRHMIFYKTLTPIVYTSVKDSGVLLTLRYLCEPKLRRGMTQSLWEEILEEFANHSDIELAYPTVRYYRENE